MKIWVPEVVLVVRDQGSGKIVTIGGTTRPDLVRRVADVVIAEADRLAAEAGARDPVVGELLAADAQRLERSIDSVVRKRATSAPRLVPTPDGGEG